MAKRTIFLLAVTIGIILIPGLSFASPLSDYSLGKAAVTIVRFSDLNMKDQWTPIPGIERADGKDSNLDWSITTGLGGNLALEYRQFNPETANHRFGMDTQELNVLYKIDPNLTGFIGWHQSKFRYFLPVTAENENVLQGGIIGKTQIAPKTQLYGVLGIGKNLRNFETGVAYEIDKHIEIDVVYRYKKVKDMDDSIFGQPYKDTVTAHGFGFGVTYTF